MAAFLTDHAVSNSTAVVIRVLFGTWILNEVGGIADLNVCINTLMIHTIIDTKLSLEHAFPTFCDIPFTFGSSVLIEQTRLVCKWRLHFSVENSWNRDVSMCSVHDRLKGLQDRTEAFRRSNLRTNYRLMSKFFKAITYDQWFEIELEWHCHNSHHRGAWWSLSIELAMAMLSI